MHNLWKNFRSFFCDSFCVRVTVVIASDILLLFMHEINDCAMRRFDAIFCLILLCVYIIYRDVRHVLFQITYRPGSCYVSLLVQNMPREATKEATASWSFSSSAVYGHPYRYVYIWLQCHFLIIFSSRRHRRWAKGAMDSTSVFFCLFFCL